MKRLWAIARVGFWLGATVFGGLNAAYPLIRERARDVGNISAEEVDGLYTLAVALPGPSFLNLWGAVCARAAGVSGAVVGELSLILPAFVLVLLLPLATRIPWVAAHAEGALQGAIFGTSGLLFANALELFHKSKTLGLRAVSAICLAALLLGMHPVLLLALVIGWGAVSAYLPRTKEGRA